LQGFKLCPDRLIRCLTGIRFKHTWFPGRGCESRTE
jgi:hypothetical protein